MKKDLNELRQITFSLINKQDNNDIITNIDTNLADKNKRHITLRSIEIKKKLITHLKLKSTIFI